MRILGLDIGSSATKAVVLDESGEVVESFVIPSTPDMGAAARRAIDMTGHRDAVITTGYGRMLCEKRDMVVTEITALAAGANQVFNGVNLVVDMGGQDSKAVKVGQGRVLDFVMNDRCAAGTGRFLEVMSRVLGVPLDKFDETVAQADKAYPITSTCTVFAESEVVGLMAKGVPIPEILKGLISGIAQRVTALAGQIGIEEPVVLSGGPMRCKSVAKAFAEELGVPVYLPDPPNTITAMGAAYLGLAKQGKRPKRVNWKVEKINL